MSNFRKFISLSAIAVLGVTNLLTPLSYASAATKYDALTTSDLATHNLNFEMPDKDVYLYAHTEANHYFVEYSGTTKTSGEMSRSEFIYDQHGQHLSGNAYAKTGYTFSGWQNGSGVDIADGAEVYNWTTTESGTVPIYAQWNPNRYYITYNLNDSEGTSSGVHSKTPTSGLYDQTLTILNPSRTGYIFSGWYITGMDNETHVISGIDHQGTTDDHEMATSYKNLHASGGTVNFMARWDRDYVKYLVEYFKENLEEGTYTKVDDDTIDTSGQADTEISPVVHTYTGFKSPDQVTTGIKADGSTYVRYNYERNSYTLTMNAGRGIDSVTATGTVSANVGPTETSATGSFKYDEPLTLSFVLSDGYENPQWSGSNNSDSSFTMPAANISKTAYATPIVYTITYDYLNGNPQGNPTSYTIESGQIVIPALNRTHSYFDGWIGGVDGGEQLASAQQSVTIPAGSTGNRTYTATWSCHPGYTLKPDGTECIANEDTMYKVRHYLQDFSGGYTILTGETIQTGKTDTDTAATPNTYEGFEVAHIETGNINGYDPVTYSGMTVVDIQYRRLNYEGSTEITTGVTSITHVGANDDKNSNPEGHHQYDDVVTITATTGAGYTFSGWTITDGSRNDITDQLLSGDEITSTTATFNMPASEITIKANVTTNTYTISIDKKGGQGGTNSGTTYTVEQTVTLVNPTRDHSDFVGWSGTDLTAVTHDVTFSGRAYDSIYEAVWKCHTGYHMSGDTECVANTYHVIENDVDGEGHGAPDEITFTYDQTGTLPVMPSQSGYDFVGWTVEGMSGGVTHYIGEITVNSDDTYTYSGTSLDFMNLTVENGGTVTLTARWSPRNDTKYVVNHYLKNVDSNSYTLSGTFEYSGTTDTPVNFSDVDKEFFGFTYSGGYVNEGSTTRPTGAGVTSGNIEKDGSLVINLYYDRNIRNVYLSGDAHVATLTGAGAYEYGDNVTVDMTAETGYHFTTWEKRGTGWVALP